jgi:DNA-binding transcriptional LysR family regulator
MEWQQIIGFTNLIKLGSFTRAARATFRTQSALSQQIKNLEVELDISLIERIGKRNFRLTSAGESFLQFSVDLLSRRDHLIERLNEIKGRQVGRLRLAVPCTSLHYLLPDFIDKYKRRFPRVELTILDRPPHSIIELVKQGEVDFGSVMESAVSRDILIRRWEKADNVLLVPANHPLVRTENITLEEVAQYPLILPPKNLKYTARKKLEEKLEKLGIEYRIAMESSNLMLTAEYVKIGLGISFLLAAQELQAKIPKYLDCISLNHYFKPEYGVWVMRKDKLLTSYETGFLDIIYGENHRQSETNFKLLGSS